MKEWIKKIFIWFLGPLIAFWLILSGLGALTLVLAIIVLMFGWGSSERGRIVFVVGMVFCLLLRFSSDFFPTPFKSAYKDVISFGLTFYDKNNLGVESKKSFVDSYEAIESSINSSATSGLEEAKGALQRNIISEKTYWFISDSIWLWREKALSNLAVRFDRVYNKSIPEIKNVSDYNSETAIDQKWRFFVEAGVPVRTGVFMKPGQGFQFFGNSKFYVFDNQKQFGRFEKKEVDPNSSNKYWEQTDEIEEMILEGLPGSSPIMVEIERIK